MIAMIWTLMTLRKNLSPSSQSTWLIYLVEVKPQTLSKMWQIDLKVKVHLAKATSQRRELLNLEETNMALLSSTSSRIWTTHQASPKIRGLCEPATGAAEAPTTFMVCREINQETKEKSLFRVKMALIRICLQWGSRMSREISWSITFKSSRGWLISLREMFLEMMIRLFKSMKFRTLQPLIKKEVKMIS